MKPTNIISIISISNLMILFALILFMSLAFLPLPATASSPRFIYEEEGTVIE